MKRPTPIALDGPGIRLEPLGREHAAALERAASDGTLWELVWTSVPAPGEVTGYIQAALRGLVQGTMLPWVVRELGSGEIVGSTRFHDIVFDSDRVEIGYTWYAKRWQRTFVNTACKLTLLRHAFDDLECGVVGLRTDILNLDSQAAIERLGAHKDGVIRRLHRRKDGTIRDTVMYSILREEWPAVREQLEARLQTRPA